MAIELKPIGPDDFESLLSESIARIPVHAPEWTHVNESDPGVTVAELFAFMAETLLYRANRIPDRNRLKFLQLLRLNLRPASPAQGFVVFDGSKAKSQRPYDAGLRLAAGNVPFLTTTPVTILPVEARVLYKKPTTPPAEQLRDLEAAYEGFRDTDASKLEFYTTTPFPQPMPGEDPPSFDVDVEARLDRSIWIALLAPKSLTLQDARDRIAQQTLSIGILPHVEGAVTISPFEKGDTLGSATADVVWEISTQRTTTRAGSALHTPRYERLEARSTTDVLRAPGIVNIVLPTADRLVTWTFDEPADEGAGDYPPRIEDEAARDRVIAWVRMRFRSTHPGAELSWIGTNAAEVVQSVRVVREFAGRGTNEPDQVVKVAGTPVLADTIVVEVEEKDGTFPRWTRAEDFLAHGYDDAVYTLDPEAGEVRFGTGINGRRPPLGMRIAISYQYGGGREGNVPIGAIGKSPDIEGTVKVANPLPTWGGSRAETIGEAEQRIPGYLRHRDRAVTRRDFRDVVRSTPGVDLGRTEILPLYHPTLGDDVPGVVTILVIPEYDPIDPRAPRPDTLFLHKICDYVEPRRLLTTEIHVVGPCYVPVWLSVGVKIRGGHSRDLVLQQVRDALFAYLSPLTGGPDDERPADERGWPLRKKVLARDLEAVVTRVNGVEYVQNDLLLAGANARGVSEIVLAGVELPRLVAVAVTDGPPEPIEQLVGDEPGPGAPEDVVSVPVVPKHC